MSSVKSLEGNTMKGDRHETRIALLEQIAANTKDTLKEIKDELIQVRLTMKDINNRTEIILERTDKKIDAGFDRLDKKMDIGFTRLDGKIDTGFEKISSRIWFNFYWGVATIGGVLSLLAHALKWI